MSSIWTVRRSPTDAKVAGLCGGVAEHWGIDPVLVRVGWALLALSGGVGVVLYLAGWLLIPVADRTSAPLDDLLGSGRRWPKEVWLALVVVACVAAFATFGTLSPFGVGPAVILACVWYFGFYRSRRPGRTSSRPDSAIPPATPFSEAADAWRRRIEEHTRQYAPTAGPAMGAPQPWSASGPAPALWPSLPGADSTSVPVTDPERAARAAFLAEPDPVGLYAPVEMAASGQASPPARRRGDSLEARRLRLTSLIILGLALSGLGFADRYGWAVSPAVYAATALLVVGLTLVAATWLGRARGLLPLGLLLVPVVLATAVLGPVTHLDRWTPGTRSYTAVAQLPTAGDSQQAGELVVDLTKLPVRSDVDYSAHLGTGQLQVLVPPDANVVVDYAVDLGQVEVDGRQVVAGGHLVGRTPPSPTSADDILTLHLSVDRGQVEVRR